MEEKTGKVFWISAIILTVFVFFGTFYSSWLDQKITILFDYMTETYGSLYLITTVFFMGFCFYLAISKYGSIRLGSDGEKPQYSFFTWIGMLFSAGFGIGLVFWGVAEPMKHYVSPPLLGVQAQSAESMEIAMRYSMFHWGIHQWSVFTVVGLVLAYFQYRKRSRSLISAVLAPLGTKKIGVPIDVLAVVATVTGVATSLGMGVLQINGGLHYVFGIPIDAKVQLLIILVLLLTYMISSFTGIDKGIKILSNFNLSLTFAMLLFILMLGPTLFIIKNFFWGMLGFFTYFSDMSFPDQVRGGEVRKWTVFYWAWAIAWAPFVGSFIARVSKGRTIREFVFGVLLVPGLVAMVWMAVMGGAGFHLEMFKGIPISATVEKDVTTALFMLLEQFPFYEFVAVMAIVLIITFLVTSADSATFVLGMMTSNGDLNPSLKVKCIWGVLQASIAGVLLLSSGLQGLQTASLIAALPFTFILIAMCLSLYLSLRNEVSAFRTYKIPTFNNQKRK